MELEKRGRGRPKGSGIDDSKVLSAIADMLIDDPSLRMTTAYKRISPKPSDASVRRILAKWQVFRGTFLVEAERRKLNRLEAARCQTNGSNSATASSSALDIIAYRSSIAGQLRTLQVCPDIPAMRAIKFLPDVSAFGNMKEFFHSPEMRLMRELRDGPLAEILRAQKILKNNMLS